MFYDLSSCLLKNKEKKAYRRTHIRTAVTFDDVVDALARFTALNPSFIGSSFFFIYVVPARALIFLLQGRNVENQSTRHHG